MVRKKKKNTVLENVRFTDYAALGKAIARPEGKVLFAGGVVPGDVADVSVTKSKKDWAEGRIIKIKEYAKDRIKPVCRHFGICGGCQWQMLPYTKQLEYKEQETKNTFKKAGIDTPVMTIVGSDKIYRYRNKLEFAFSNKEYLIPEKFNAGVTAGNALGYHMPGLFDKVLDITECHLMERVNDEIRNSFRDFALKNKYPFYDVRNHEGWLRNMVIRYTTTGECLVNIVVAYRDESAQSAIKDFFFSTPGKVTTLLSTINPKLNDTIYDLDPEIAYGPGFISEKLGNLKFKISPKSFFQTNTLQAQKLYDIAKNFARLSGDETVFDLYCGTGSIGLYLHNKAKKIIGVETIEDAVKDAAENASINGVSNAAFFCGDVIKVCTDDFFRQNGTPDVVILDPPRAGLHEKLIRKLLEIAPKKIVYVSCNISTQARDLNLLKARYTIDKLQPVDMFPQTYHIECVAQLTSD